MRSRAWLAEAAADVFAVEPLTAEEVGIVVVVVELGTAPGSGVWMTAAKKPAAISPLTAVTSQRPGPFDRAVGM